MAVERSTKWQRLAIAVFGLGVVAVLASTWLSSSRSQVYDVGAGTQLLVVSDAGPVRVRSMDSFDGDPAQAASSGVVVRTSESWLVRGPVIEQAGDGESLAFRVTCPSRFPCRASVEVFLPEGVAVSIVAANDAVQVDSFDGALSIFAGDGGVSLGAVSGSVSIVSSGAVVGDRLGPEELTVDVINSDVTLHYLDPPRVVAVVGGAGEISISLPDGDDYLVDAQAAAFETDRPSVPDADRLISVRSDGEVVITTTNS